MEAMSPSNTGDRDAGFGDYYTPSSKFAVAL
jgi:hypothetical protein